MKVWQWQHLVADNPIHTRHIQKHLLENTCEEMPFNTRHLACFSLDVLVRSFKVRVMRT